MPAPSDLVHETATTTGTGNFTLSNENGKRSFNTAFGSGAPLDVFDYFISHRTAAEWERGTGHLSAATTLVRDTVLASSNAGAAVNFSAGTKDVTNDVPAAKQARYADTGNHLNPVSDDGGQLGTTALKWSDLHLATGAVINYNSGNVTITQAANALAFDGTSSGFIIGGTAAIATQVDGVAVTPQFQIQAASAAASGIFMRFSADAPAPAMYFAKSRNAAVGSHTVVQSGDQLGRFSFAGSDGTNFAEAARIDCVVDGTPGTNDMPGKIRFRTSADGAESPLDKFTVSASGACVATAPLGGLGYGAGVDGTTPGGAVTQVTSRTTGVTLDKVCGAITLVSAAGSTTFASFTVTNSAVAATDTVIVVQKSGTDLYEIHVTAVAAGSFRITFRTTGGTTSEQPVFNFAIIRAVAS